MTPSTSPICEHCHLPVHGIEKSRSDGKLLHLACASRIGQDTSTRRQNDSSQPGLDLSLQP